MSFNYQNYINDVLNKNIVVCDAIYKAVKRHADDLTKSRQKDFLYYYVLLKMKIIFYCEDFSCCDQRKSRLGSYNIRERSKEEKVPSLCVPVA